MIETTKYLRQEKGNYMPTNDDFIGNTVEGFYAAESH